LDELDFSGKRVLIVGGSSGIGNGTAHAFRRKGAAVHVTGTRADAAAYAGVAGSDLDGLGYSQLDVSVPGAVEAWTAPFDSLDVLVLSQGAVRYSQAEFDAEVFRQVIEVNLVSLQACASKFRSMLSASKGSLITISSAGAFRTTRGNPAYSASKAGAVHLTRNLADAWAREGIRVNGVAPGLVATKMTAVTTDNPERLANRLKGIPAARLGTVDDIAGAVLFLASPLSAYIYGQTLVVDGGRILS
jgi:3-oxoacyl-[acyl-carrier protein] reductase